MEETPGRGRKPAASGIGRPAARALRAAARRGCSTQGRRRAGLGGGGRARGSQGDARPGGLAAPFIGARAGVAAPPASSGLDGPRRARRSGRRGRAGRTGSGLRARPVG
jgi:hypothetical protein